MKIYDSEGWVNWPSIYPEIKFICAMTGPRGTGKTYGLLKYIVENDIQFIYLRRLRSQLDICAADESGNPFKAVNRDLNTEIMVESTRNNVRFIRVDADGGPRVIGYGAALSTVATVRGIDYSDVDCIVFDEFIANTGERPVKGEYQAFLNFIETVNRNRELSGNDPVKVFLLGNANTLCNPYFVAWHFMGTALRMIRGEQMVYRTPDDTRVMILLLNSEISKRKKETVLYQTADTDFVSMAIDNAFRTDATRIGARKLTDCRHVVSIGEIGIYQLKSTGEHYVSSTINRDLYYEENDINIKLFKTRFALLKQIFFYDLMLFESYDIELLFRAYFDI